MSKVKKLSNAEPPAPRAAGCNKCGMTWSCECGGEVVAAPAPDRAEQEAERLVDSWLGDMTPCQHNLIGDRKCECHSCLEAKIAAALREAERRGRREGFVEGYLAADDRDHTEDDHRIAKAEAEQRYGK